MFVVKPSASLFESPAENIMELSGPNNEGGLTDRRIVLMYVVVTLMLEFALIGFTIFLGVSACLRRYRQRRDQQCNSEQRRAAELLSSPPQPADVELNAIHAHSPSNWPLTDGVVLPTTTCNTPNCHTPMSEHSRNDDSLYFGTYVNGNRESGHRSRNLTMNTNEKCCTEPSTPGIVITDTESNTDPWSPFDASVAESDASYMHTGESYSNVRPDSQTSHSICSTMKTEDNGDDTTDDSDLKTLLPVPATRALEPHASYIVTCCTQPVTVQSTRQESAANDDNEPHENGATGIQVRNDIVVQIWSPRTHDNPHDPNTPTTSP